ncbi:hypothetical protein CR513_19647, partial [Mucuna pruriens]
MRLKHNLLSIGQLCENGYDESFNKGECIVKDYNDSIIFSAKRQNNLYKIDMTYLTNQNSMTRSSSNNLHKFDPEIDRTLYRLRKARSTDSNIFDNKSHELEQMENNNRTLKELATPYYPQLEPAQSYELKSGLIHLLPKFHGLVGEDLHKHLKEFHVVCSTMRLQGILEDYIKMKAFPFSLDEAAKD